MRPRNPHPDCAPCGEYLERRAEILPREIIATAQRRNVSASALLVAYVEAVHERHLSGLSLDAP